MGLPGADACCGAEFELKVGTGTYGALQMFGCTLAQ